MRDFELSVQRVYEAVLRPGGVAIDVGAHIGRHTLPMAAAVAPGGRVFAFEPLPSGRQALANDLQYHHPELQAIVEIFGCALSNYAGQAEFTIAVDTPWYSGLRERRYDSPTQLQKIAVQVETLDGLFPRLKALDYIKVDAEGGEYHIFQGAAGCLEKFRPVVTFEFGANTLEHYDITCRQMGQLWMAADYRLYDINGEALASAEAFAASAEAQHVWDYAAIPAEREDLERAVREALKE